jgi:hypothetical protein
VVLPQAEPTPIVTGIQGILDLFKVDLMMDAHPVYPLAPAIVKLTGVRIPDIIVLCLCHIAVYGHFRIPEQMRVVAVPDP